MVNSGDHAAADSDSRALNAKAEGFAAVTAADICTPLASVSYQSDGLLMQESSLAGKISLRGDFTDPAVSDLIRETVGLSPVLEANTFVSDGNSSLYWLGPDERAVYTDIVSVDQQLSILREKLPAKTALVDVSDYYTVIRLTGEKARPVLASGTPLDLHRNTFRKGQCAQTRFGTASVLLSMQDDIPVIDLQVRWSFAEYVWKYLCKVADYC